MRAPLCGVGLALIWAGLVYPKAPELLRTQDVYCRQSFVTGYVRGAGNPWTYDGTSIWTGEAIAAAGWDIEMGSVLVVDGLGSFRVADRGRLGPGHIDVAVWSRAEAYALTSIRRVCVYPPGSHPDSGEQE
jgi:hypothetical protein